MTTPKLIKNLMQQQGKHWNQNHSSFLQSYHIEVLSLKIFLGYMDDITWEVFKFFDESIDLVKNYLYYEGSYVDDYLNYNSRNEIIKRLETAKDKARDAWHKTYDKNDDHKTAIEI